MILLILGGGSCQLNAVIKAKQKGITVVVSDYYKDAPAKQICDYGELASSFDTDSNLEVARKYKVDGIMTMGTDQPVYTAAKVANECRLPSLIDCITAKAVTNKKVMKNIFKDNDIPSANFTFLKKNFKDNELMGLTFPVVIKPLDSQGQRGVYKLDSIGDIRSLFDDVISYSKESEILVEEFYESSEITVSGWVRNGKTYILTVTDRITYNNYPHIGICIAHDFPSRHIKNYYSEIEKILEKIISSFKIKNGPIYFQMLIGNEGIKVNEIACRIGGAYEDELIPLITGVDILDMVINSSLGKTVDYSPLENYDLLKNTKYASVQMIFTKPGVLNYISDIDEVLKLPGVMYGRFNFKEGHRVDEIINATQRAGYIIIQGESSLELKENIMNAYNEIKILDENMKNMVII